MEIKIIWMLLEEELIKYHEREYFCENMNLKKCLFNGVPEFYEKCSNICC